MLIINVANKLIRRFCSSSTLLTVSKVVQNCALGKKVQIKGWVKSIRKMKGTVFLDVNDGSCKCNLQVVLPIQKLEQLSAGSSVVVSGVVNQTPKGQFELYSDSIQVFGNCDINDGYPFAPKKTYSAEYLRQCLHFRLRDSKFASLLRVRDAATCAVHNYFHKNGFITIHTPILTSNDCEGAGETFNVIPENKEMLSKMNSNETPAEVVYFDSKAFLTVSGQLHLEAAAHSFNKVYSFGPTFRAENSKSRLHLSEFYMIEAESAFVEDLDQIMNLIEALIKNVTNDILNERDGDVHKCKESDSDFSWLNKEFVVLTYEEASRILISSDNFTSKFNFDVGLNKEQEKYLVRYCENTPVFVINWPRKVKPFYMKELENSKAAALDLLVPNVGELVGGGLRERDYNVLKQKLPSTELTWYLDLRKFGGVPTGGFGLGFERYLQFLLGINNIKDVIPFPRWPHSCKL